MPVQDVVLVMSDRGPPFIDLEVHMHRRLSSVLVMLTVAACAESTVAPAGATFDQGTAFAAAGGIVESATGSAHRIRPLPDGQLWVLTFDAKKFADGSVTGEAHVDRHDLGVSWSVDVTCLSVVGNTAWIGGIMRNSKGGLPVDGAISYFYVIDNGEGNNAAPDRASAVRLNDRAGEDIAFCTQRPLLLVASDIAHGNVQVR
jgi:hypothetical protein